MSKRPLQKLDKYQARLPDGMRERLKKNSKTNNRSLNAEIVARLESTFEQDDELDTTIGHRLILAQLEDLTKAYNELVRESAFKEIDDKDGALQQKLDLIITEILKLKD